MSISKLIEILTFRQELVAALSPCIAIGLMVSVSVLLELFVESRWRFRLELKVLIGIVALLEGLALTLDCHTAFKVAALEGFKGVDSLFGVFLQHFYKKFSGFFGDFEVLGIIEVEVASPVLSQDFVVLFAWKNRSAEEKIVEDDACRKYIANRVAFGGEIFDVDYFGGYKTGSSAPHEYVLLLICECGQSEVADSEIGLPLVLEHDVLGFKVPVDDPLLMKVGERAEQVFHYGLHFLGGKLFLGLEAFVELVALQVLQNHIDGVFGFEDALDLHHVSVVNTTHQLHLVLQRLPSLITRVLSLLRKCLHCEHPLIYQSLRHINCSKCSLSNFLFCFKQFMKISLIYFFLQLSLPHLKNDARTAEECDFFGDNSVLPLKLDALRSAWRFGVLYWVKSTVQSCLCTSNLRSKIRGQKPTTPLPFRI